MNALELIERSPQAFTLLSLIALRARWKEGPNAFGLHKGEALIGDWRACGMTEQQYRTAKKVLSNARLVTFRRTNWGTIAKLISVEIFDINMSDERSVALRVEHPVNAQNSGRATTNREERSKKQEGRELLTSERIALEDEKNEIDAELKRIKDGAFADAFGEKYTEAERTQRRKLLDRREAIKILLYPHLQPAA